VVGWFLLKTGVELLEKSQAGGPAMCGNLRLKGAGRQLSELVLVDFQWAGRFPGGSGFCGTSKSWLGDCCGCRKISPGSSRSFHLRLTA